ncbi:MAG TPA: PIN domain-containing protein [Pyrinomonadaceae bacterium]
MPDKHELTFLDTAYVYALVNTRDEWHQAALSWQEKLEQEQRGLITTELILVEIADGLASIRFRSQAAEVIAALQSSPLVEVVAISSKLLTLALNLYRQRDDKEWGLTDCFSFVVMRERGLRNL